MSKTGGGVKSNRSLSLDALRGIIMLLMAMRHAEIFLTSYVTPPEMWGGPMPDIHFGLQYWTRFAGHICPTGFFFLMGIGMTLFYVSREKKGWVYKSVLSHLAVRGVILIGLQFFFVNILWVFDNPSRVYPDHTPVIFYFGVLYCLGSVLVLNALLLRFSNVIIIGIGAACVIITNVFVPVPELFFEKYSVFIRAVLIPGQTGVIQVLFPILPWFCFTSFGIVFGRWFLKNRRKAYRRGLVLGLVFIFSFVILRFSGGFGNFIPYSGEDWRLFFFISKFPPSLAYISVTFGEVLILLWIFSKIEYRLGRWGTFLSAFGRSALFFYFVHIAMFAVIGQVFFRNGTGLVMMYVVWGIVVVILYSLCQWYGNFKSRQSVYSIWRFF